MDQYRPRFGHDVLDVFDIPDEARDFLADVIESPYTPYLDRRYLIQQSLLAGAESWEQLIHCALAIRHLHRHDYLGDGGNTILDYVYHVFDVTSTASASAPWLETDRLIAVAKGLQQHDEYFHILSDGDTLSGTTSLTEDVRTRPRTKKSQSLATSHYWSNEPLETTSARCVGETGWASTVFPSTSATKALRQFHSSGADLDDNQQDKEPTRAQLSHSPEIRVANRNGQTFVSPYFLTPVTEGKRPSLRRPSAGVVSCVPFPPLDSTSFGLVQEKLANEPFWLLIAVTFLIRTQGKTALPVFYSLKERFPTPADIEDPKNAQEITAMIRHLGLSSVRLRYLQKYAGLFRQSPPAPGKLYRVPNYDRRDRDVLRDVDSGIIATSEDEEGAMAWEIGHMTKGKYAIDSWRIFCRDKLLGRAEGWAGEGREPEFQPEWMRVTPQDKELRALLRWMWMREGWEWDPETGERSVLRGEMQEAVNDGRVEYDDSGGLRIIENPKL